MSENHNWQYCVVGNIEKTHTDESGTLRYGTVAFSGGTKVYLCGRLWDKTKDHIDALGRSRCGRYQVLWTDIRLIENVRLQKTYKPRVIEIMNDWEFCDYWWGNDLADKTDAEEFVKWWNREISKEQ